MSEEKRKTDEEILFPDVKVGKQTIRPWTYGQFSDMLPNLMEMAMALKDIGIDMGKFDLELDKKLPDFFRAVMPHSPAIIAKTLGIDEAKVRGDSDVVENMALFLTIITINVHHLKNLLGLGMLIFGKPAEPGAESPGPSKPSPAEATG